jgi:hypothetical protein
MLRGEQIGKNLLTHMVVKSILPCPEFAETKPQRSVLYLLRGR